MVRRFSALALIASFCVVGFLLTRTPAMARGASADQPRTAYQITVSYVKRFYPLWFTYKQWNLTMNKFVGPRIMGPIYHLVVAPNDDTLYVSTPMNLTDEPVIVTIPSTTDTYSLFTADAYGDVFNTAIPANTAGVYGLTGPDWTGMLPQGVTQIPVPFNYSSWIIRADRFSPDGKNEIAEANRFRSTLQAETLSAYLANPNGGRARIVSVAYFGVPFKQIADSLAQSDPIQLVEGIQTGVHSGYAPPLNALDQRLSDTFDALLASNAFDEQIMKGVRDAHTAIIDRYLEHTRAGSQWISFNNIGHWGVHDLDRSSITEFLQYGNDLTTAAYFQTFNDSDGNALDGSVHSEYILNFPKELIPPTKRFWSVTAYLPNSITLYGNKEKKYLVGSYTPGLVTNSDGSVTIYIAPVQPDGVPAANWLPVPAGPFNLMLRDYGPEGIVAKGIYIPPPVTPAQ